MKRNEVVITHTRRTPIGRFLGTLAPLSAVELGTAAVRALLDAAGLEASAVDEVLMGHGRQVGSGTNSARQVTLKAGLPDTTPAATYNRACGSSLTAIWSAYRQIALGESKIVVAGGMESMTNIPFLLPDMRKGYRLGHAKVLDGNYKDGFTCPLINEAMGMTAEYVADKYEITREEMDTYALESFRRWEAAEEAGRFKPERAAIEVPQRKGDPLLFDTDEHGRKGMDLAQLTKLPPVFRKESEGGRVHAGNSSGITDGGAAVLVMSLEEAQRRDFPILARLGHAELAGVDPHLMGIGPVPAIRKLCESIDKKVDDFDLIELNEAFAAQVIGCDRELSLPMDRCNVNGGAIALGHPIGATGARIVCTLLSEMQRRDSKLGMASLCMSGGLGMAVSFHRD